MVYIDNALVPMEGRRVSHMIADTQAELLRVVEQLRIPYSVVQDSGTYREHFPVFARKRMQAIDSYNVKAISVREMASLLMERKLQGVTFPPITNAKDRRNARRGNRTRLRPDRIKHATTCPVRRGEGNEGVRCAHGYGACPVCDRCTCGVGVQAALEPPPASDSV